MARKLTPGDPAPEFEARTAEGATVKLSDYRGRKNVVLYFYPKDFTPGCTAEACSFRDAYDELQSKNTEVIGVSLDSEDSHGRFAQKHGLRFPLLSDPKGAIARAYGALGGLRELLGAAQRVTFVIDKSGTIRGVFHHELRVSQHMQRVRDLLTDGLA